MKVGKTVTSLKRDELDKLNAKWNSAIIIFVVGYTPTIATVSRFIAKDWNHV